VAAASADGVVDLSRSTLGGFFFCLPRNGTLNVAVGFNPRQIEFIASLRDAESNFLAVPWVETHGYVQASLRDEYKKKGQDLQRSRPD